jgi:hypothetical protein
MANVVAPNGLETHLRAIVFKEGNFYIAQCLEYDICAQAGDIDAVLDRLDLVIETEFELCCEKGAQPKDCIAPAPNYYHELWEKRSLNIERVAMPTPNGVSLEVAFAKAA